MPEAIVAAVAGHHEVPVIPTLAAHVYWADRVAGFLAFGFLGTSQPAADVARYEDLRRGVQVAGEALPKDAEELFAWLVERVST